MGYSLEGAEISCDIEGILSEGICFGAVQIPADGQPIILLNDRPTIGGYPKIGSVLSIDCARLAQLPAGSKVRFEAIDIYGAQHLIQLAQSQFQSTPMDQC
jgi:allophanate hydrolase subunit 2